MIDSLNRQLAGWAAFYKFTDFTAHIPAHRHGRVLENGALVGAEIPVRIKPLMRKWYRVPEIGQSKTWLIYGRSNQGNAVGKALRDWSQARRCSSGGGTRSKIPISSGTNSETPSPPAIMMSPWPWAKVE
jgi:hypothetical protein